jgi:hypothetical protein
MRSRQRLRDLAGRRRRSFSTEDLKRRLCRSTAGEPASQFSLVDREFVTALGADGKIVKVREKLLVLGNGKDDRRSPALSVCLVLHVPWIHFQGPPGSECSTARVGRSFACLHRLSPPDGSLCGVHGLEEDDAGVVRFTFRKLIVGAPAVVSPQVEGVFTR